MAMDRRQFLGKSALALGAAFSLTSLGAPAEAASAASAPGAAAPACPEVSGLEKWLLETGRGQMDGDVFAVACQSVR
jgi:nitrous oxide reductase